MDGKKNSSPGPLTTGTFDKGAPGRAHRVVFFGKALHATETGDKLWPDEPLGSYADFTSSDYYTRALICDITNGTKCQLCFLR